MAVPSSIRFAVVLLVLPPVLAGCGSKDPPPAGSHCIVTIAGGYFVHGGVCVEYDGYLSATTCGEWPVEAGLCPAYYDLPGYCAWGGVRIRFASGTWTATTAEMDCTNAGLTWVAP